MCEKERESEGESHTCSYLFSVYKNFYGLGAGPWKSLEKIYLPAMLCFQDLIRLKITGFCCNATTLWLEVGSIFLRQSVRRRERFSVYETRSAVKLQDIIFHWSSRGTHCCDLRSGSGPPQGFPSRDVLFGCWMVSRHQFDYPQVHDS